MNKNTITFVTPEPIDPKSWMIMGLNAKPNSGNPIGYFGTGLKMAIAVLLRTGHEIQIKSGQDIYNFDKKKIDFRGKEMDLCYCNDQQLPFTTELGKNWETWMAYRELVSNTRDEGGFTWEGDDAEGMTRIIVTGKELYESYKDHDKYFCEHMRPIESNNRIELFKDDGGKIYYKGILVYENSALFYSYNLLSDTVLTEDRTLKDQSCIRPMVETLIESSTNEDFIREFVTMPRNEHMESTLGFWGFTGNTFNKVITKIYEETPFKLASRLRERVKSLSKTSGLKEYEIKLNEQKMLNKALVFLHNIGYNVDTKFKFVKYEENTIIAFYEKGIIYLTQNAFNKGVHYLTSTILEEYFHDQGYKDEDRAFEQHLINEIINHASKNVDEIL